MKTVTDAFFDPDGQHLVAMTRGRFHFYRVDTAPAEPTVEKLWDHPLSQVFWAAFGRDVVIASNTSDKHVAIDKRTGEVAWERPRPKRDGICGRGIVTEWDGEERYIFTGYKQVYEVSTKTGEDIREPWPIEFWTRHLHLLPDGQLGAMVPAYVGADRDHVSMAALDFEAQRLNVHSDLPSNLRDPLPTPDGSGCVSLRVVEAGLMLEMRRPPENSPTAGLLGDVPGLLAMARWSPRGRWLGCNMRPGYLIIDNELDRWVEVPYGLSFGTPDFHPDEHHVLLPRDRTSAVDSIESLFEKYG